MQGDREDVPPCFYILRDHDVVVDAVILKGRGGVISCRGLLVYRHHGEDDDEIDDDQETRYLFRL